MVLYSSDIIHNMCTCGNKYMYMYSSRGGFRGGAVGAVAPSFISVNYMQGAPAV